MSSQTWGLKPGKALEFEAMMRLPDSTPGMLAAFYVYQDVGYGQSRNEIDFEVPHVPRNGLGTTALWLNVWRDGQGLADGFGNMKAGWYVSNLGWGQWFAYKIRWTSTSVQWSIGGNVVRTISRTTPSWPIPNEKKQLSIHFNIWAPPGYWTMGDSSYLPSSNQAADSLISGGGKGQYFDVMWVKVRYMPLTKGKKKGS